MKESDGDAAIAKSEDKIDCYNDGEVSVNTFAGY